jgi:hypothetical protein
VAGLTCRGVARKTPDDIKEIDNKISDYLKAVRQF